MQSLLRTIVKHVQEREFRQRSRRKLASSQLFGLIPADDQDMEEEAVSTSRAEDRSVSIMSEQDVSSDNTAPADWTMYDADFFAMPWLNETDEGLQDFLQPGRQTLGGSLADIPLFPMYDQMTGSFGPDPPNGI